MTIDATGVAVVIAAIGGSGALVTAIGTFVLQWRAETRKAKKDARDDLAREHARIAAQHREESQLAATRELADEQRATHKLVDGAHTAQTAELVAIKDVVSKGQTPPEMPAKDAKPGQVTQEGGVVSVGKKKEKKP